METNTKAWDGVRESARRMGVHVLVLGLHCGMLMVVLHGMEPARRPADRRERALRLSLVKVPANTQVLPLVPAAAAFKPQAVRMHSVAKIAGAHMAVAVSPLPPSSQTPINAAEVAREMIDARRGYVAGGNLLHVTGFSSSSIRLPGSGVAVVKGIRMTDPRMLGVGGAVRKLQALLGVPDRHCVDVDAWSGLSTRELLDRHVSPAQVERTAEEYGCRPQPA